jgi:hypothetical protein
MFDSSIHLFATNILVDNHNRFMLQSLNKPIARSAAELLGASNAHHHDDDQLEKHVLLCIGQRVMLSCNLWVQAGLVNGALGVVMQIVYAPRTNPPHLPTYVVVAFDKYIGPPWDQTNQIMYQFHPYKGVTRNKSLLRWLGH